MGLWSGYLVSSERAHRLDGGWFLLELVVLGLGGQNGFIRCAPAVTDCH